MDKDQWFPQLFPGMDIEVGELPMLLQSYPQPCIKLISVYLSVQPLL